MAVAFFTAKCGSRARIWALIAILPCEIAQTWKSWISSISSRLKMSSKHWITFTYLGVASIRTDMHSLNIGTVVKIQITVKIIVVIGSAIVAFGKKNMISAAITTPIL